MKRKTGKELLVFCVLMVSFVASGATAASTVGTLDGNDTHGRLDIKWIVHGHEVQGERRLTRHRLSTRERWYARNLRGDLSFINMFFNTDGDKRAERRLTIDVHKKRLVARMDRISERAADWLRRSVAAEPELGVGGVSEILSRSGCHGVRMVRKHLLPHWRGWSLWDTHGCSPHLRGPRPEPGVNQASLAIILIRGKRWIEPGHNPMAET